MLLRKFRVINTYFRFRMPKIYKECQLCFTVHRQPSKTESKNRIINITQQHELNTQKKKKKKNTTQVSRHHTKRLDDPLPSHKL